MAVFSCVCLVSEGVLPVCFGMCAENVCVRVRAREREREREIKRVLYLPSPPLLSAPLFSSPLSEFGRGSPGAPVAVMACS